MKTNNINTDADKVLSYALGAIQVVSDYQSFPEKAPAKLTLQQKRAGILTEIPLRIKQLNSLLFLISAIDIVHTLRMLKDEGLWSPKAGMKALDLFAKKQTHKNWETWVERKLMNSAAEALLTAPMNKAHKPTWLQLQELVGAIGALLGNKQGSHPNPWLYRNVTEVLIRNWSRIEAVANSRNG